MLQNQRFVAVVATAFICALSAAIAAQAARDVRVRFEMPRDVVLNEPILVHLVIENRSAEEVSVDLGPGRKTTMHFVITTPEGAVIEAPRLEPPGGVMRRGRLTLGPGETYTGQFVLDEWTTMDRPGRYEVRASTDAIIRVGASGLIPTREPQLLTINVAPRDEARLNNAYRSLAQTILTGTTAETRIDAAVAVSLARDPIAVSSLRSVLKATNHYDAYIAKALSRIGTSSAHAVLAEMASSPDSERSRTALMTLEGRRQ